MTEHELDVQRRRRAAKLPKEGPIAIIVEDQEVVDDGRTENQTASPATAGDADLD
jgi:hypothetical protein